MKTTAHPFIHFEDLLCAGPSSRHQGYSREHNEHGSDHCEVSSVMGDTDIKQVPTQLTSGGCGK